MKVKYVKGLTNLDLQADTALQAAVPKGQSPTKSTMEQ